MYFVDEKHIIRLQAGKHSRQVSRLVEYRTGGYFKTYPQFVGNDIAECRFSQSGRAVKQHMVQRLATQAGSFYKYAQIVHHLVLPAEILKIQRTESVLEIRPNIRADRERILQVIMNILSNAIKYTPDGGRIVMTAGWQEERVWLEVSDNGIGIPKGDRERIFERFYRVDKARSRESGGTGLGLSIAQEIVLRHEGTLSLVEKDGPGTTVRMELKIGGPEG